MVVDTSALAAISLQEQDAHLYTKALIDAESLLLSAATRVELSFVIEGRKGEIGRADLEALLHDLAFVIFPVTEQHAAIAIEAFRRFGRGSHPAALNFGDCF